MKHTKQSDSWRQEVDGLKKDIKNHVQQINTLKDRIATLEQNNKQPTKSLQEIGIRIGIWTGIGCFIIAAFALLWPIKEKRDENQSYKPRLEVFQVGFDPIIGNEKCVYRIQYKNLGNRSVDKITVSYYLISSKGQLYATGFVEAAKSERLNSKETGICDIYLSDSLLSIGVEEFYASNSVIKVTFHDIDNDLIDSTYSYGKQIKNYENKFQWLQLTELEMNDLKIRLNEHNITL